MSSEDEKTKIDEDSSESESDELVTDVKWVTVAERTGHVVGHLIRSRLEAEDIPVIITGATFDSVQVYAGYDTKLRVPKRFFDEAKQIVDDMLNSVNEGVQCDQCGHDVSEEDLVCPNCNQVFAEEEPDHE